MWGRPANVGSARLKSHFGSEIRALSSDSVIYHCTKAEDCDQTTIFNMKRAAFKVHPPTNRSQDKQSRELQAARERDY